MFGFGKRSKTEQALDALRTAGQQLDGAKATVKKAEDKLENAEASAGGGGGAEDKVVDAKKAVAETKLDQAKAELAVAEAKVAVAEAKFAEARDRDKPGAEKELNQARLQVDIALSAVKARNDALNELLMPTAKRQQTGAWSRVRHLKV
jgi:outer membrane protein TolC